MSTSPPISPTSLPDLKNTTDDHLPLYLSTLPLTQSHSLTDTRLFLSLSASLLAAAVGLADYLYGFGPTKRFTTFAVPIYFVLNALITYWILAVERGRLYIGRVSPSSSSTSAPHRIPLKFANATLSLASSSPKHTPTYNLRVRYQLADSTDEHVLEVSAEYTRWFTKEGVFCQEPFRRWLAGEVPVVGALDPGRVGRVGSGELEGKEVEVEVEVEMVGGGSQGMEEATGVTRLEVEEGTKSVGRKGGKRRKV